MRTVSVLEGVMADKNTRREEISERGTAPRERPKPTPTAAPRGPQLSTSTKPKRQQRQYS